MADQAKEYHLSEIRKRKARADEIVAEAEKNVRDLTEDETTEIKSIMGRVKEHKNEVERIEAREELKNQLDAIGAVSEVATQEPMEQVQAKSAGEALVNSVHYKSVMEQARREGFPKFTLPTIELKAIAGVVMESDGTNNDAIAPTWDPTLRAPYQFPLRVIDLLTVSQVENGNSVNYPVVTSRTKPTGNPTDEGEDKKAAGFGFDFETKVLLKNTAFTGVSEEMFQDAPVIASYINNQLGLMALQVEEEMVYQALRAATTQTADGTGIGGDNGFDAIREAMTLIQLGGGNADGVLLHPNDAAYLDVQRSVTGDQYYGGGPVGGPRTAWWGGLRLVITPQAQEGTAVVGAFRQGATLYRKGGLRLDTSNAHDDWFRKDLIAIRAEIRSVLGVHNPELFVEVETGQSS